MTALKETQLDNPLNNNTRNEQNLLPENLHPPTRKKEPHPTHSVEWQFGNKKPISTTCNKAQTIELLLKRSEQFQKTAENNKDKELIILRDGKALSSQFPCSLIKDERLTVMYVTAKKGNPKESVSCRKGPSSDLVMFHVLTKGGRNVAKITRNPALKSKAQAITVFAYKGEKVKKALKKDGRFLPAIFKKNLVLTNVNNDVNTEMSCLVDDLSDKTFKIKLLDKENPPESQPSSLEEDMTQSLYNFTENQDKQNLSLQFRDALKGRAPVPKLTRIQNQVRQEFGQNAQLCNEVKTMKKLMQLSDSVCQVRVDGRPYGTGFLLFSNYVLTNGHVIKDIYNVNSQKLSERVTVNFSFESLDPEECGSAVEVDEVVGFEYVPDVSGCDWALLSFKVDPTASLSGLLPSFGLISQNEGICIIGHPSGGVKKIDPCVVIPLEHRLQVVERCYNENREHVQLITSSFFQDVATSVQQDTQRLNYTSSFYNGSSGSPVFDKRCHVVAMHTEGFSYTNIRGETQSVIERGQPLSTIVENIIVQLVERGKFDVLKKCIDSIGAQYHDILTEVKKLVESRNNMLFKNAVNNALTHYDETLQSFFEFFAKEEKPVPMETDRKLRF